jgi:hypothetical protein
MWVMEPQVGLMQSELRFSMGLPNDNFGRAVTVQLDVAGQDIYTDNDGAGNVFTLSFPTGTAQSIVYAAINSMAPAGYVVPANPLNSQYPNPFAFTAYLLAVFWIRKTITTPITATQRKTLASNFSAFVILLSAGDYAGFLAELSTITVDGTIVTSADITYLQNIVNQYLAGN